MRTWINACVLLASFCGATHATAENTKPTIVLVHGAFAESSSWNGVVATLEKDGYSVIAAANPLRGLKSDADAIARVLAGIDAPVVLVGHSYGGSVISMAARGQANVKALVYVAAFAPEAGESAATLSARFPGSTLASALARPVALAGGDKDLYIRQDRFRDQFAADVSDAGAKLMAATQRPITEAALNEASGEPAWKEIPSWFVYGSADRNIPSQAIAFMAARAHARESIAVDSASHVVMVSHPNVVARVIESAARSN